MPEDIPEDIIPQVTHSCIRCSNRTPHYAYCDQCIKTLQEKGYTLDELWEAEEDAYVQASLSQL